MGRKQPPPPKATQLDLPLGLPAPLQVQAPPGLWEAVEAFPLKAELAHLTRRKAVKRRLRQVNILEAPAPAPDDD